MTASTGSPRVGKERRWSSARGWTCSSTTPSSTENIGRCQSWRVRLFSLYLLSSFLLLLELQYLYYPIASVALAESEVRAIHKVRLERPGEGNLPSPPFGVHHTRMLVGKSFGYITMAFNMPWGYPTLYFAVKPQTPQRSIVQNKQTTLFHKGWVLTKLHVNAELFSSGHLETVAGQPLSEVTPWCSWAARALLNF